MNLVRYCENGLQDGLPSHHLNRFQMCLDVLCLTRTYMVCLTPPEQIPNVRERIRPNANTSRVAYGAVRHLGSTRRDVVATDKAPRGAQPSRAKRGRRRRRPAPKAPPSLARAAESSWDASKLEAKRLPQTQLPQVGGHGRSTHRISQHVLKIDREQSGAHKIIHKCQQSKTSPECSGVKFVIVHV